MSQSFSHTPFFAVEKSEQVRKAPISAPESLQGPGSILTLLDAPNASRAFISTQEGGLGYEYPRIHAGDGITASAVPVLHLRL